MRGMADINYLTPADVYRIAEQTLGREPMVRDRRTLHTSVARPAMHIFGQDAYPTLVEKAAALLHALTAHHPFFDGNKRVATAATIAFLQANGLRPMWSVEALHDFVLEIAQHRHDVEDVAAWLAEHTQPAS